jgi:hypothetical protein
MATSSNGTKDKDAGKKPESVDEEADEKDEGGEDEEEEGGEEGEEAGDQEDAAAPDEAAARAKDHEDTAPEEPKAPAKATAARDSRPSVDRALRAVPVKQVSAPPPTAGLGKSVMLFVVVVGGLSLLMVLLGQSGDGRGNPPAPPKWTDGQVVDLDITLVSTDRQDLACASGTEVAGLHCMFESQGKRWSKGDPNDDKKTLRPYSTTANVNFLAAGIWSEPALAADKLPNARFTLKCKYKVAGKMPRADVRWHEGEGWNNVTDWYAGSVSDCKIGNVQN